eukprot:4955620-Amphidinium_carterae.1
MGRKQKKYEGNVMAQDLLHTHMDARANLSRSETAICKGALGQRCESLSSAAGSVAYSGQAAIMQLAGL